MKMQNFSVWLLPALAMVGLGALVGLLAGLSLSPVVGGLLSLLFAFAGGSIGIWAKKGSQQDRVFNGLNLFLFAVFTIGGILLGIYLRNSDFLGGISGSPKFALAHKIGVPDILSLQSAQASPEFIITLIKADRATDFPAWKLSRQDVQELVKAKVRPEVLSAMLLPATASSDKLPTKTFLLRDTDCDSE